MATITTCDGSGVEIPAETPVTGQWGHQYCEELRPVAEKYLEELTDLHTANARKFAEDLAALRARYRSQLRQLPDE